MSNRASAGRYAKALFDVAAQEGSLDQAATDLTTFAALVESSSDLQKAFQNPAIPVAAKRGIVDALVQRTSPSLPVTKLLGLLATRDRLELIADLNAAFHERLREHRNIVRAEVITAQPLGPDAVAQFETRLAGATGRTVSMTTRVDPAILGGMIAKVGSTVYDGSVATQLARMRERLVERS